MVNIWYLRIELLLVKCVKYIKILVTLRMTSE